MFSTAWSKHKKAYDFIVIGSGYGGAIAAARIATANLNPKPSVCILERGKEWWPPDHRFPDTLGGLAGQVRGDGNPHGIFELLRYRDITVWKGCGLGGTSLINANIAATPDPEVFDQPGWPKDLNWERLKPYYDRARKTIGARPDPRAWTFAKVQAMDRRAQELGLRAVPLDLAINFDGAGLNEHGVPQRPCRACGNCTTGCNRLAKRTLYMNYLPMARNAGASIFVRKKVTWIERLPGGGWRVHGEDDEGGLISKFTLDAANVILAAGSINSTEILLRSETRGLRLSPRLGTRFSCNGDFFGLAYNSDMRTNVSGFGARELPAGMSAPGPAIVSAIHYNGTARIGDRFQIEDLSIPSAYLEAARNTFPLLQREDSDTGDEAEEQRRIDRDRRSGEDPDPDGALNHSMFYLVMGIDDAGGRMVFDASRDELRVVWDDAGRQHIYTRLNEELRRHARALGASYIANPLWTFLDIRHLITAHPIGGCPMGEDHEQGAVDQFGRVFTPEGGVYDGLFVCDGSLIPSSIGVNPFLTISAVAEQIAERKIRQLAGEPYPEPAAHPVAGRAVDPFEVAKLEEPELERLFKSRRTLDISRILNSGERKIDLASGVIENDTCWRGFFPQQHVLNAMSAALFTGFKKTFRKENGKYLGVTGDTDGRIRARNTLEEVNVPAGGDLEPGRYLLLRYTDPPWQGFYDLLKVIQDDVVIGRVYLGAYPNGVRLFTFAMTRVYRLSQMTIADHRELYQAGAAPSAAELAGAWRMDVLSNANQMRSLAVLEFDPKPDGRLESRYHLAGLIEGLVTPKFLKDHFELSDFTPFHDEIRKIGADVMVGKYVTQLPESLAPLAPQGSLGLLHFEESGRFGFYYVLTRAEENRAPMNSILRPFLDVHLPDGLGMTFDEEMIGWYAPGPGDPGAEKPQGAVDCSFRLRMTVRDLNEFIEGRAHEARARGTIRFGDFDGRGPVAYAVDESGSRFQYLTVNPETGEAEMRYQLRFATGAGQRFLFDGRKYMQKDRPAGPDAAREVLDDYTTLYARVHDTNGAQAGRAFLKFRTFEDIAAAGSFMEFLKSFQVTGTEDALLRAQGLLRFLAFTAQFVQHEYDPLAPAPPA